MNIYVVARFDQKPPHIDLIKSRILKFAHEELGLEQMEFEERQGSFILLGIATAEWLGKQIADFLVKKALASAWNQVVARPNETKVNEANEGMYPSSPSTALVPAVVDPFKTCKKAVEAYNEFEPYGVKSLAISGPIDIDGRYGTVRVYRTDDGDLSVNVGIMESEDRFKQLLL